LISENKESFSLIEKTAWESPITTTSLYFEKPLKLSIILSIKKNDQNNIENKIKNNDTLKIKFFIISVQVVIVFF
jgi:hypothetical protein